MGIHGKSRKTNSYSRGTRRTNKNPRYRAGLAKGNTSRTITFYSEEATSSGVEVHLAHNLFEAVHYFSDPEVGLLAGDSIAKSAPLVTQKAPPALPKGGNGYHGRVSSYGLKPATGVQEIEPRETEEDGLPVSRETEAISAWKVANLRVSPDGTRLEIYPATQSQAQEIDAKAICTMGRSHKVPELTCSCGFYCYRSVKELRKFGVISGYGHKDLGQVLLSVDLKGKIIEHERLMRAEHQIITTVYLPGQCYDCGEPAEKVVFIDNNPKSVCYNCGELSQNRFLMHSELLDVADIANHLGTECRFFTDSGW